MNTQASAPSQSLAGFAAMLREHGLKVGVSEQQAMLQAALALGPLQGQRLCAAWRAMACHSARDWRQWPELFERYWYPQRLKGQVRVSGQMRPSRDLRQAVQELHKNMEAPAASANATSRGWRTPPSAQTWAPSSLAAEAHSSTAEN